MDINTVKSDIIQRTVRPWYMFTGPEVKVQDIYIEKLAEVKGLNIVRVDSVAQIFKKVQNKSFVQTSSCYVTRDDRDFITVEKAWENLESVIGDNLVILIYSELDNRSKFAKRYKEQFVQFEHMSESVLVKHIQQEIQLDEKSAIKLAQICEYDYSRVLLEIDKIKTFDTQAEPIEAFNELLYQKIIYTPPKDAIFEFTDAVLKRQVKAFDLLSQSYAVGEATMVLLSVLYNNVKQVLQVQSCKGDVAKTTGLTAWQIKCARDKCGQYSDNELMRMLRCIQYVEKGVKTGTIDEKIAVEYVLVRCM